MTKGDTTLEAVRNFAAQPFEGAQAMPASAYCDQAFLGLEMDRIFKQDWICVGRASGLSAAGDYLALEVAGEPIVVLRDREGALRAYSNVCLHRMSTLLTGRGNCPLIVCPYHAWTYGLDGRLRSAPHMENSGGFGVENYRLPEIRLEVWQGFIFVTLDPHVAAVAERLATLEARAVAPYRLGDYVETFREEQTWNTNWKCLAENYMESYHLSKIHKDTVGKHSKTEELVCVEGDACHNLHWIIKDQGFSTNTAHPDNRHLPSDWHNRSALFTVYPGLVCTLTPGYFWYLSVQPQGTGQVRVIYGGGLAPEFAAEATAGEQATALKALLDRVNAEDMVGVEAVYRGLQAALAKPGHLNYLEQPVYEFGRYVARKTLGED